MSLIHLLYVSTTFLSAVLRLVQDRKLLLKVGPLLGFENINALIFLHAVHL